MLNFPVLFSPLPVFHSLLIYSFPLSFSSQLHFDLYPQQVGGSNNPDALQKPQTSLPSLPPQPSESPCVRLRVFGLQYKQVMNLQKDSGIVNERRGDKGRGGKVKVQFCR